MQEGQTLDIPEQGEYEVTTELGEGVFGTVYRLIKKGGGDVCAVKVVKFNSQQDAKEAQNRVDREAEVLMKAQASKYVITLRKAFWMDRLTYGIVMDYADGGNLQTYLEKQARDGCPLGFEQIFRFFEQLLIALQDVHERDVIHRDIKPANILLVAAGEGLCDVRLADFGVSKQLSTRTQAATTLAGTRGYMAPEVGKQEKYTMACDIYSLGVVIFQLCTLGLDLPKVFRVVTSERPLPLPEAHSSLGVLLMQMLDPAKRRPTAASALEKLRAVRGQAHSFGRIRTLLRKDQNYNITCSLREHGEFYSYRVRSERFDYVANVHGLAAEQSRDLAESIKTKWRGQTFENCLNVKDAFWIDRPSPLWLSASAEPVQSCFYAIILDDVQGDHLKDYLKSLRERLDVKLIVRWLLQLLHAVSSIHSRNAVHGCIQLSNILLVTAACSSSTGPAQLDVRLGSPSPVPLSPVPPEVCQGQASYDARADLWCLGAVMKELCMHPDGNACASSPPPPDEFSVLQPLILKLSNPNPAERPSVDRVLRSPLVPCEVDHAARSRHETILMDACRRGHSHCARAFLLVGANVSSEREEVDETGKDGVTALMLACKHGHEPCARACLEAGADANRTVVDPAAGPGWTALMYACQNGHEACARALLEAGADTEKATLKEGSTALIIACERGHEACARACLKAGSTSMTKLMVKCSFGDEEGVRECLAAGAEVNNCGAAGWTALMWACYRNHEACALAVIQQGAQFDKALPNGRTALMIACEGNYEACACAVIDARANVNAVQTDGWSALMFACEKNHEACARALIRAGAQVDKARVTGRTALMEACYRGHDQCARPCLEAGANVDNVSKSGWATLVRACCNDPSANKQFAVALSEDRSSLDSWTALMFSCAYGFEACARALIGAGALVDKLHNLGRTALMYACDNGHDGCARAVLQAGAEVDKALPSGHTALMIACEKNYEACARALLGAGAEIDKFNGLRWTALMFACQRGREACASVLIKAKADPKTQDAKGNTALTLACQKGSDLCTRALIESGAEVDKADNDYNTALMWACRGGHERCARALIEAKADLEAVKSLGFTALMLACQCGHDGCAGALLEKRVKLRLTVRGLDVCARAVLEASAEVDKALPSGHTALMIACEKNHDLCASALIKAGAQVDKQSNEGVTALQLARRNKQDRCAQLLEERPPQSP